MTADEIPPYRRWSDKHRSGRVAVQDRYDGLARASRRIRNVEMVFVPGLVQTPEYVRCRMRENVRFNGEDESVVEPATEARLRRQEILADPTRRFEFVVGESVLRTLLCPPAVMLRQLDRLTQLIDLPHVTFGIIPFGVELPVAPQTSFVLFDDLAIVETFVDETQYRGAQAAAYHRRADALLAESVTGDAARVLLTAAADALRPDALRPDVLRLDALDGPDTPDALGTDA
ncbi:DUF5753 domain-containing protein [Actinocatenispora rupis]|uniref:DUF5753 domain-containing protein n=1 Tax=Actinocatenispora rupis TaxID=519421 RepID=A0A8J3JG76_9ACTN|nr:DUF5753 domain-containing protein [Actinocatenispora rupis]GID14298.1 hypothetical protein Aru02nite_51870 [Actinocatenispora rupis]